jgi:hypothetical protein
LPYTNARFYKQLYKSTLKNAQFGGVGEVLDVQVKTSYEVEINGKDVIFDKHVNFLKFE